MYPHQTNEAIVLHIASANMAIKMRTDDDLTRISDDEASDLAIDFVTYGRPADPDTEDALGIPISDALQTLVEMMLRLDPHMVHVIKTLLGHSETAAPADPKKDVVHHMREDTSMTYCGLIIYPGVTNYEVSYAPAAVTCRTCTLNYVGSPA